MSDNSWEKYIAEVEAARRRKVTIPWNYDTMRLYEQIALLTEYADLQERREKEVAESLARKTKTTGDLLEEYKKLVEFHCACVELLDRMAAHIKNEVQGE